MGHSTSALKGTWNQRYVEYKHVHFKLALQHIPPESTLPYMVADVITGHLLILDDNLEPVFVVLAKDTCLPKYNFSVETLANKACLKEFESYLTSRLSIN